MEHKFAVCRVAVAPLRDEASDRAEIKTQLLFGDEVEVLEQAEPWWRIRNAYDGYEGWMDFKQLKVITVAEYLSYANHQIVAPASALNVLTAADGSAFYIPASAQLPAYRDGFCYLGEDAYRVDFKPWDVMSANPDRDLAELSCFFLNAPYLWGGKTLFGIDCSGITQAVFKLLNIRIRRDAIQQAEQGETVDFLPEVKLGDLAFFDNADGRIIHVGIMLDGNRILHASGQIRIDPIDDQGIFNPELGRYSHKLRIIKRFF